MLTALFEALTLTQRPVGEVSVFNGGLSGITTKARPPLEIEKVNAHKYVRSSEGDLRIPCRAWTFRGPGSESAVEVLRATREARDALVSAFWDTGRHTPTRVSMERARRIAAGRVGL
ncbi:hypothetical protein QJS10_CPA03g01800 [Acorus calamus]|uniref:Uncharacterized protein n=1 Tax=Acorus calamus TaxID=4465 RepID=A0AAV9F591_ACOCL|nr:hypothetical protein QJS10_CPA03g01800 [Acorus calamus]